MKKIVKVVAILLALCCIASVLGACVDKFDSSLKNMNETVESKIITDFVAAHSEDAYPVSEDEVSLRVYGAFDGVYVLFVDVAGWAYTEAIQTEVVAGVKFVYSCGQTLEVYCDGAFYSLTTAYEKGIISRAHLRTAQRTYKGAHSYLY